MLNEKLKKDNLYYTILKRIKQFGFKAVKSVHIVEKDGKVEHTETVRMSKDKKDGL